MSNYRSVYFNSSQRTYGSNSNPTFYLDTQIESVDKIKILATWVPISYYYLKNDTLILTESAFPPVTLTLNGNYNIQNLTSTIRTFLNTNSQIAQTFIVAFDTVTSKLTINSTIDLFTLTGTAATKLSLINQFGGGTGFSTSKINRDTIDLSYQFVTVQSPELTQAIDVRSRSFYDNNSNTDTIIKIPITVGHFDYNYYANPVGLEYLTSNKSQLQYLSFKICDVNGNELDLNGVNWAIKIGIITN